MRETQASEAGLLLGQDIRETRQDMRGIRQDMMETGAGEAGSEGNEEEYEAGKAENKPQTERRMSLTFREWHVSPASVCVCVCAFILSKQTFLST